MKNFNLLKIGIVIATLLLLPTGITLVIFKSLNRYADAVDLSIAFLLFPVAMIWSRFNGNNFDIFMIILAVIQFPVYALILGLTKSKKMLFSALGVIIAIHLLAVLFAFLSQ